MTKPLQLKHAYGHHLPQHQHPVQPFLLPEMQGQERAKDAALFFPNCKGQEGESAQAKPIIAVPPLNTVHCHYQG